MSASGTSSFSNGPDQGASGTKSVLIVEDESIISFGYRLQLEQMGLDVMGTARSSEEAEQLIALRRPDVIIMDIYLKGTKTGLDLAREIHATGPVKIIFLTASARPDIVEGIRALDGCHYLLKPVDQDSLMGLLHSTVTGHA